VGEFEVAIGGDRGHLLVAQRFFHIGSKQSTGAKAQESNADHKHGQHSHQNSDFERTQLLEG
jgi:hypothetical protein